MQEPVKIYSIVFFKIMPPAWFPKHAETYLLTPKTSMQANAAKLKGIRKGMDRTRKCYRADKAESNRIKFEKDLYNFQKSQARIRKMQQGLKKIERRPALGREREAKHKQLEHKTEEMAKEVAENKAKEEAERKAKEKADQEAREEADTKAKDDGDRKAKEEALERQRRTRTATTLMTPTLVSGSTCHTAGPMLHPVLYLDAEMWKLIRVMYKTAEVNSVRLIY